MVTAVLLGNGAIMLRIALGWRVRVRRYSGRDQDGKTVRREQGVMLL